MIAQLGVQKRFGWRGVTIVTLAGIAPDVDVATKFVSDADFWRLHHALGHNIFVVTAISLAWAGAGRVAWRLKPVLRLFAWCTAAGLAHLLTDSLYWWSVKPLWPMSEWEVGVSVLEYLDLIVLAIWLVGALLLYRFPSRGLRRAVPAGEADFVGPGRAVRLLAEVDVEVFVERQAAFARVAVDLQHVRALARRSAG
jgi:membrane-bound metal-dependent hydrolase YbcI (DUF457 family)